MEPCCSYNFGLYPHNADIILDDLLADADGIYTVCVTMPGGVIKNIPIDAKAGDELIIPQGQLNEDATIKFRVFDIHGLPMLMEDCDSFKLQTYINSTLKCHDNTCDDSDNPSDYYSSPYGYN